MKHKTYRDLFHMWQRKRSGPGWTAEQRSEKEFKQFIYDHIIDMY